MQEQEQLKRITYWPQAWLGIAMNAGLAVAWIAVTGEIDFTLLGVLLTGLWGYDPFCAAVYPYLC